MNPTILDPIQWKSQPVKINSEPLSTLQRVTKLIVNLLLYIPRTICTYILSLIIVPSSIGGTRIGKIAEKIGLLPTAFQRKSFAKMDLTKMKIDKPLFAIRECKLTSAKGKTIQATLFQRNNKDIPKNTPTIIFFCPQQVSHSHWAEREMIKAYQQSLETFSSVNFLMVEYPHMPTGHTIMEAAETAYDFVASELQVEPQHITAFGKSLGGFAATYLTTKREVGCLIIDRSGTSLMKTAEESIPKLLHPIVHMLLKNDGWNQFETVKTLNERNGKTIIIYHEQDQRFQNELNLGRSTFNKPNIQKFELKSDEDEKDYHSHRLRKGTLFYPNDDKKPVGEKAEDQWLRLALSSTQMTNQQLLAIADRHVKAFVLKVCSLFAIEKPKVI